MFLYHLIYNFSGLGFLPLLLWSPRYRWLCHKSSGTPCWERLYAYLASTETSVILYYTPNDLKQSKGHAFFSLYA